MAEDNPDGCVVNREKPLMMAGIEQMMHRIRRGEVCGERLQEHHRRHLGHKKVVKQWLEALLSPEDFWKLRASKAKRNKRVPEVLK